MTIRTIDMKLKQKKTVSKLFENCFETLDQF